MWDGLFILLLLCICMAGISLLVGSLPLSLTLSARQLRLVTCLGTGVLVGTALIVIIPEGIEMLYGAAFADTAGLERRWDGLAARGFVNTRVIPDVPGYRDWRRVAEPLEESGPLYDMPIVKRQTPTDETPDNPDLDDNLEPDSGDQTEEASWDPHPWVGISLLSGFVLMYLIDTLPKQATTSTRPQSFSISLRQLRFHRDSTASTEGDAASMNGDYRPPSSSHIHGGRSSSTTVGLVIHAVADGIALGASSTLPMRLTFIIFIALMIHKAPAAFGLTSVLLKEGLSKRMIRAHLAIFSLAAPVGALLTWAAVHLLGFSSSLSDRHNTEFSTGVLVLFSGGTFLYVAMHSLQESGSDAHNHANGYANVPMSVYGKPRQPRQRVMVREHQTPSLPSRA